jgi:hypothetical protein
MAPTGTGKPRSEGAGHADLVLVKAINTPDALVRRPRERIVIKAGRVVARDGIYLGDSGDQRGR